MLTQSSSTNNPRAGPHAHVKWNPSAKSSSSQELGDSTTASEQDVAAKSLENRTQHQGEQTHDRRDGSSHLQRRQGAGHGSGSKQGSGCDYIGHAQSDHRRAAMGYDVKQNSSTHQKLRQQENEHLRTVPVRVENTSGGARSTTNLVVTSDLASQKEGSPLHEGNPPASMSPARKLLTDISIRKTTEATKVLYKGQGKTIDI